MKGYRFLIPLLLVVMMGYSTYSLVSTNIENQNKYKQYVKKAQEYAKQGIVVDSLACYKEAISLVDSAELRVEVADMLTKNNHKEDCVSWLETAVEQYPENSKLYEKLLAEYIDVGKFEESYELVEEIENRELVTEKIKKLYAVIKYKYELDLDRYEDAVSLGSSYFAVTENEKKGLIFKDLTILFNEYDYIGGYHDELISVSLNGEKYYVDEEGNKRKVLPESMECEYLGDICDGLISIKSNGKYSFYNKEFQKKFGEYEYASNFNEGIAAVKEGGNWYLINTKGHKIGDTNYTDIKLSENNIAFKNGRAFVKKEDEYVMVDNKGKSISDREYEDANIFEEKNGLAAVKIGGSWTFIDKSGKQVIKDSFDEAKSFSIGIGAIKKDGYWGYIDEKGRMVIDNIFKDVKPFSKDGVTLVSDEEGWMVMSLYRFMD